MKTFFKMVTANLLAYVILGVLLVGGGFFMLIGLSVSASKQQVTVPDGGVLVLNLRMNISDSPQSKTLADYLGEAVDGDVRKSVHLRRLCESIKQASYDDRIEAIFLKGNLISENYGSSYAAVRELREELQSFKAQGKKIYAYGLSPTLKEYYLFSVADEIIINPYGFVSFNGMASQRLYLAQAFDKYGIGVQTTRVGKYKSAVEMFTREEMSPADRQQTEKLVGDLWSEILTEVAEGRGLEENALQALADERGYYTAEDGEAEGLVDRVAYLDEVIAEFQDTYGVNAKGDSFQQIGFFDYLANIEQPTLDLFGSGPTVAVVYAEGDIVDGRGEPFQVGGARLARSIRKLRNDDSVKALVLRVNSPGGSAVASELIQRELRLFGEEKPVIVSMGGLAASGGYWISAYADKIYAEPTTITGSIGVFGLIFNIEELSAKIGLGFDSVKTAEHADLFTVSRPKTVAEMKIIQAFTDQIYDEFLTKVAEGRGLELERVRELAQGRVWSGTAAKELGLVDEIGGLQAAIDHAAEVAGLGIDWEVREVPKLKNLEQQLQDILEQEQGDSPVARVSEPVVSEIVSLVRRELELLNSFNDPRGVYARMPFRLEF